MKYYDIKTLLKKNCTYSIAIGKRSDGKTFSSVKYALEKKIKDGSESVYIRRWVEDIKPSRMSKLIADFNDLHIVSKVSKNAYQGLTYYNRGIYLCNYDDNGKAVYNQDDILLYLMALSEMEHDKSTGGYSKVRTIIFDEFISRGAYISNEFIYFQNVLSTVLRGKDNVRIIMLGNTVSVFCPYFKEMGIRHVQTMKQGAIDVYQYSDSRLKIAVEYISEDYGKHTNDFYFAFDNPKLQMITKGNWEIGSYPHCQISFKEKDVIFRYYIDFNDRLFECQVVEQEDNLFTFIFQKTTPINTKEKHLFFCLDASENMYYCTNILKPNTKLGKKLLWFFTHDKVFYSDNEVGNNIHGYLRECEKI